MVTLVTPLVNPVKPPKTPEENVETLLTTDAAKADPGIEGIEMLLPLETVVGVEVLTVEAGLETVGS